jgi:hypothetical protein
VENWVNDYENPDPSRYGAYTALFYSFLTLDPTPSPDSPRDVQWAGDILYETMTLASILDVMGDTTVAGSYHWQYRKIKGLMDYCASNGKRFIWALGGWSDLKRTIADDQISALVNILVSLLKNHGGDGVAFDWEHASDAATGTTLRTQQRHIVGKTIKALRDAFDSDPDLSDKWILYTPRYNAFFPESGSTYGNIALNTDGEGIDVLEGLDSVDDLDYVHFMMYDLDARSAFSGATEAYFVQDHYDKVIQSSIDAGVPTSKLIMGFEPGVQA